MCPYVVYAHYEAAKTAKSTFLHLQCIVVYSRTMGTTETSWEENWGKTVLISALLWD